MRVKVLPRKHRTAHYRFRRSAPVETAATRATFPVAGGSHHPVDAAFPPVTARPTVGSPFRDQTGRWSLLVPAATLKEHEAVPTLPASCRTRPVP